eukprot:1752541-Prorocentrum_lima.AAC.1
MIHRPVCLQKPPIHFVGSQDIRTTHVVNDVIASTPAILPVVHAQLDALTISNLDHNGLESHGADLGTQ